VTTASESELVPEFDMGDRLRKARESAGYMSQEAFARAIDLSRATVSNYERGGVEHRMIVLKAWARETNVSLEWLMTGKAPQPTGGPGGGKLLGIVRHEGFEPPTRWLDSSYSTCDYPGTVGKLGLAA
jgi:transcriptional regulator with XRE-family HTH domain